MSKIKSFLASVALMLVGGAWAATPVVVWDGDFGTLTKDGCTLDLSTHAVSVESNKVTIAAAPAKGVKVGWESGFATTTVLVKHNGLPDCSRLTTLIALKAGGNEQRVGVNLKGDSSFGTVGYWNGSAVNRATGDVAMDRNPGVFAIKYKPTNDASDADKGTRLVEVVNGVVNERFYEAVLMGGGDQTTGVVIGGNGVNNGSNYTGFEITGIAIFNTILSDEDIAAYQWPSETVVFETNPPTSEEAARFRDSSWKGTVWLKNMTVANFDLAQYGNANSTIRLTGFKGYSPNSNNGSKGFDGTVELVDEGDTKAWTITDTYGSTYYVAKLKGDGTFTTQTNKGGPARYAFKNVDGFTGSIDLANGGRSVTIGDVAEASDYVGASGQNTIKILSGASATIAAGKTWKAASGLVVEGTLTKEYGATVASGTTLSGSGEVIALGDATAERALSQIGLAGLTAAAWTGTLTIKDWRGQADANQAKFGNLYGNSASTIRFDGYNGYSFMATFNAVKAYDIAAGGLTIRGGYTNGNAGFVGALTGDGPITISATGSQNATSGNIKFIGDVSGYTGTVSFDNASTFRVAFLAASDSVVPSATSKEVLIGAGVTAFACTTTGTLHMMEGAILNPVVAVPEAANAQIDNGAVIQLAVLPQDEVKVVALENAVPMALPVQATIKVGEEVQTAYGLAQKTDGVYVVEQEELTWVGESGTAITADGVWDAVSGGYAENAEYGKFVLPSGKTDCVIKVPAGTADIGLIMANGGSYVFEGEGQAWQIGSLLVSEGASVTFKNIDVDILSSDVADPNVLVGEAAHIAFPSPTVSLTSGATLTVNRNVTLKLPYTPSFNTAATIAVADAATLAPGVYKLMSWEKADAYGNGFGLPKLDTTGYTPETNAKVRLVPEVKALWLQVQSAAQAARKPLVIMPFGDSITEGANGVHNHANYRIPLFQKLSLAGYNVKSVGFHNRTSTGRDQFHAYNPAGQIVTDEDWEMHSGVGSERLGAQHSGCGSFYDSWANALDQAGNPDVVLMHCGINDMLNNTRNIGPDEAYVYFTNIVQKVMNARPDTKFVITSPMCCEYGHSNQNAAYEGAPGGKDTNRTYVQPLNALIVAFFKGVQAGTIAGFDKSRLFYADVYNAIMPGWYANDPQLDLNMKGSDHCHPSWVGHDIMAKTWFDQVVAACPQDKDGNYDCHLAEIEKPAAVDSAALGAAAKTELANFRKGYRKARVLKPTGAEKFVKGEAPTYGWADSTIADDAEIEKVGYFVEYVFPSATTNIHRWVWVDMDAFGAKTVASAGLPTSAKTQQTVTSLHVCGNHPAVYNTTADAEGVEGYLDFGPFAYGTGAARGEGAPARWMNRCWDDAFDESGVYGAMQVHRKFATNEELGNRGAQTVFAYNGWARTTEENNEFGIGNFSQHFSSQSLDWTGMGSTATMNASVLQSKTIEIWVKVAGEPEPTTPTYDEVTKETPLTEVVPAEQAAILEKAGVTADKVAAWAKSKGGCSGSATAGGAIDLEAFALGCAPGEVETTKANFKVNFDADGNVVIEGDGDFNIKPVLKHSSDLKTWGDTGNFSKAVIEL